MTLTAAIAEIQRVGKLTVEGQVIHCDAPDPAPPEVSRAIGVLRQNKDAALRLLRASAWPPECLAAERKFCVPAAKLYPLLNHLVLTPEGPGKLLSVFQDRVEVHLQGESETCRFRPEQIAVCADAPAEFPAFDAGDFTADDIPF